MAYSTIYNVFNNHFGHYGFICERPKVSDEVEGLKEARKYNRPVFGNGGNSVAFPDNYKLESIIELSAYGSKTGTEYTGYYRVNKIHDLEGVLLYVKDLLVKVAVPVKHGFFQSLIKKVILEQTHTISMCNRIISVQGKFKFVEGFLELDN